MIAIGLVQSVRRHHKLITLTSGIREAKRLLGTPVVRITANHAHSGSP
jgi:hypothetical protein